ncbi:CPBP family intramembrane glutamic endopeptidase [Desulfosarcina cetonica]|uniref:CPBP family intramembrane glutamic endopeptidase n=1 Tax=Desulfosarcina cetonica TaxID=90730 RepID=UPI00155DA135|nr:CPBP family intramembrane glutamic endopeptidase [Desulfosarcina cetonica]
MNFFQSRAWLILEFATLFLVFPVAFTSALRTYSPVPFLVVFGVGATVYLIRHPDYTNRSFYDLEQTIVQLPRIVTLFVVSGVLLFLFVWVWYRDWLFYCPINHRQVWFSILWTYALFAVYPQEIIYRGFFFHRYRHLFTNQRQRMHASAIAFSFAHLIYYHHYSILFSLIGGYLFAHTYQRSKSLIAVSVEHALYGCFMYTIGLGRFFYSGFDQLLR